MFYVNKPSLRLKETGVQLKNCFILQGFYFGDHLAEQKSRTALQVQKRIKSHKSDQFASMSTALPTFHLIRYV